MSDVIDFSGATNNERRSRTPHNDLTGLCDRMIESIPEDAEGVSGTVMLNAPNEGAMAFFGYGDGGDEGDLSAIADVVMHLNAHLRTIGMCMAITLVKSAVPGDPS